MIGEKDGIFFAVFNDSTNGKMQAPDALAAMAVGFYYAIGPNGA